MGTQISIIVPTGKIGNQPTAHQQEKGERIAVSPQDCLVLGGEKSHLPTGVALRVPLGSLPGEGSPEQRSPGARCVVTFT